MSAYTIANSVPTPEEMGEILGLSSDRVEAVRRIMSTRPAPMELRSPRKAGTKKAASKRVAAKKSAPA